MGRFIFKIFFCLVFPVFAYASPFQEELDIYLQQATQLSSFGESVKVFSFSKTSVVPLLSFFERSHLLESKITEKFKKFLEMPPHSLGGETVRFFTVFTTEVEKLKWHTLLLIYSGHDIFLLKVDDYLEVQDLLTLDIQEKTLYLIKTLRDACEYLSSVTSDQILSNTPFEDLLVRLNGYILFNENFNKDPSLLI